MESRTFYSKLPFFDAILINAMFQTIIDIDESLFIFIFFLLILIGWMKCVQAFHKISVSLIQNQTEMERPEEEKKKRNKIEEYP